MSSIESAEAMFDRVWDEYVNGTLDEPLSAKMIPAIEALARAMLAVPEKP